MVASSRPYTSPVPALPKDQVDKKTTTTPASVEYSMEEEKEKVFEETERDVKGDRKKRGGFEPPMRVNPHDTTINCLVDEEQQIISCVQGEGFNQLIAQARTNYGVKKGRFFWEMQFFEVQHGFDFNFGVSLPGAKWVGGEQSIAFGHYCKVQANGETIAEDKTKSRHVTKEDVIGILLNTLDAKDVGKVNSNTISIFVNGERASEPIPLPEDMVGKVLFPHMSFKNCTIHINFGSLKKPPTFSVQTFTQAATTELERSKLGDDVDKVAPKIVCPIGRQEGWVEEYVKESKEQFLELTESYFKEWLEQSNLPAVKHAQSNKTYGLPCLDHPHNMLPWINHEKRNVIYGVNQNHLFYPFERTRIVNSLPKHEKIAVVVKFEESTTKEFYKYYEASLPKEEEGFDKINFIKSKDESEVAIEAWKYDQKLRSKVEDLKIGTTFQEKIDAWTKFVTEKKETDEGKEFTEEDWMLAELRAQFLFILEAFKEDVKDETRPSFLPALWSYYYRIYIPSKYFDPRVFACKEIGELLTTHLTDTVKIGERGLLASAIETVSNDAIFDLANKQRKIRLLRVNAGDELSELQFSAKNPPPAKGTTAYYHNSGGGHKGKGGYFKGGKRPGGYMSGPPTQRQRF